MDSFEKKNGCIGFNLIQNCLIVRYSITLTIFANGVSLRDLRIFSGLD